MHDTGKRGPCVARPCGMPEDAIQLIEAGVLPKNITMMQKCTFEDEKRLFSHRRDTPKKGATGDMAGYIRLV